MGRSLIVAVPVKQRTGFQGARWRGAIEQLRPGHYVVSDRHVGGEAPKDFVHVYEYGDGVRKKHPHTWPSYIAKVGHKWYPAESITEQLLTRVGQVAGIRMAESKLMYAGDQIRFLSKYFLGPSESLVHGAEIIAGYLEDVEFVKTVGDQHLEKDIFTFPVLYEAILTRFPDDAERILRDFARMIGYDALVGNQDRHLYNWGVVVHATGAHAPEFSPIYDSARGLFWNAAEMRLDRFDTDEALRKYITVAHPLIGWEGERELNHFQLVSKIAKHTDLRPALRAIDLGCISSVVRMVDTEFSRLLSERRRDLIKRCLRLRFQLFADAIAGT